MKFEILPFTENMIPEAGRLLAERHKRNRLMLPLLPARFEDPLVAAKAVELLWRRKVTNGYAAFRNGKIVAYLIGECTTQFWARCGYIYLHGNALAADESPSILQDLYSRAGDEWNKQGYFNHYIYLSAADSEIIDAWFSLGFGRERVDVSMDLTRLAIPTPKRKLDFEIRRAEQKDRDSLSDLSGTIAIHQSRAPRWHPVLREDLTDLQEGWAELVDEPDWDVWLAVQDGQTVGSLGFHPIAESDEDMVVPPNSTSFTVAAVKDSFRGQGIMTGLVWHGLEHAKKAGVEICTTDWQTANLLAARTWERLGFTPSAYRLARTINPMIAWANYE